VAGLRGTLDRIATRVYGIALPEQQPVDLRVQNFQSEEDSMDRAYKQDIPSVIKRLEGLRDAFATLDSKTDWTRLRIEPLLEHREVA
jgi:hypothetical protein